MQKFKTSKMASPTNIISRSSVGRCGFGHWHSKSISTATIRIEQNMNSSIALWHISNLSLCTMMTTIVAALCFPSSLIFCSFCLIVECKQSGMCKRFKWQVFYRLLANVELQILMLLFSYHACYRHYHHQHLNGYRISSIYRVSSAFSSTEWGQFSIDLHTIEHANIDRCMLLHYCSTLAVYSCVTNSNLHTLRLWLPNFVSNWIAFCKWFVSNWSCVFVWPMLIEFDTHNIQIAVYQIWKLIDILFGMRNKNEEISNFFSQARDFFCIECSSSSGGSGINGGKKMINKTVHSRQFVLRLGVCVGCARVIYLERICRSGNRHKISVDLRCLMPIETD